MSKRKVTKAILTDGGWATRFLPVAKTIPKSMLPLFDKPIIHYFVEECAAAGIKEIIIVSNEQCKAIFEDYFNNRAQHIYEQLKKNNKTSRFKKVNKIFSLPKITVITQDTKLPYGNAVPALCAKPYINGSNFAYIYTDDFVIGHHAIRECVELFNHSEEGTSIIAAKDRPDLDPNLYGMIKLKDKTDNELDYIIEKPTRAKSPSSLISFGIYILENDIFKYMTPTKEHLGKDNELWTVDAITRMNKEIDKKILVKPVTGNWVTTGDPINYLKTIIEFSKTNKEVYKEIKPYLKA